MKSKIVCIACILFCLFWIQFPLVAQHSHLKIINTIAIPEEAGKINVVEFLAKDSTKFNLNFGFKNFMDEVELLNEPIDFNNEEYHFVIPDSTIVDEVDLMNGIQGCAIDLNTEAGKKEARKRLHVVMWILKESFAGNHIVHLADVELDEDFFKYNLGWFRLNSGIIIKLQLYLSGGVVMLWPQMQSNTVNTKMERFLVVPTTEIDLCKYGAPKGGVGPNIYDKIPDIRLPDVNGDTISLYSLKGKYVYIDFWASWCSPCRAIFPRLIETYNKYKDKTFTTGETGLEVFAISLDNDKQKWIDAIKMDGTPWPYQVMDANSWNGVFKDFIIGGIPAGILIDGNGIIIGRYFDPHYFEKRLK